jgi:hypothetical protein
MKTRWSRPKPAFKTIVTENYLYVVNPIPEMRTLQVLAVLKAK